MSLVKKILKRLSLYFKYKLVRFNYDRPFPKTRQIIAPLMGYVNFKKEFPNSVLNIRQDQPNLNTKNIHIYNTVRANTLAIHKLFTYKKEKTDHWQSHFRAVLDKKDFIDDCDGFALTCAEFFYWVGIDRKLINIVFCETESGTGHLVCVINNILIDNRFPFPIPWHEVDYNWIMAMNLDEPGIWRTL